MVNIISYMVYISIRRYLGPNKLYDMNHIIISIILVDCT